jgi:hypothetical protein
MTELPDGIKGECIGCGGDGEAPNPLTTYRTTVELWDTGTLELFLEKFDLSIGKTRTVKRRMNVNQLDFRWKSERELHESLGPVFAEMIAEFDAEVEKALA